MAPNVCIYSTMWVHRLIYICTSSPRNGAQRRNKKWKYVVCGRLDIFLSKNKKIGNVRCILTMPRNNGHNNRFVLFGSSFGNLILLMAPNVSILLLTISFEILILSTNLQRYVRRNWPRFRNVYQKRKKSIIVEKKYLFLFPNSYL